MLDNTVTVESQSSSFSSAPPEQEGVLLLLLLSAPCSHQAAQLHSLKSPSRPPDA